jgi:hypothetical protein
MKRGKIDTLMMIALVASLLAVPALAQQKKPQHPGHLGR